MQTENLSQFEVKINRLIKAPRALVWEMWTNPKHLAVWWGPKGFVNPVCHWEARPGGKMYVGMQAPDGTNYPMDGDFVELINPEKLVFISAALDENGKRKFEMLNIIRLSEEDENTRFDLTATAIKAGTEALPYLTGAEEGWNQSIDKLETLLADSLMSGTAISIDGPFIIERVLSAPVDKVWKAITENDQMKQWYFQLADFQAKPGFEFTFNGGDQTITYKHNCRVIEVIAGKKISYSWRYEDYEGNSLVTFELFPHHNKTILRLTHSGLHSFPQNNPSFRKESFAKGWTHIIGKSLKEFVEK